MTGHDVMAGYSVIALVTLAALIQYFLMGLNVGRARGRLNVPAPATQGHPEFERLYRVDQARSRGRGGSGLGLSICKSIVEAHQGRILAMPSSLGGLKILIRLPLSEPEEKP